MKKTISLSGKWDLYYFEQDQYKVENPENLEIMNLPHVPANVPGNVEISLSEAGVIEGDLFKGMKTVENYKYEDYEWWYKKEFETPKMADNERLFIKFGAVDCFADYYINGEKVYSSENAFMEHRFEITDYIKKEGKNTISVNIKSTAMYAYEQPYNQYLGDDWLGFFPTYIRKPAHSFGWDIFPRCISAGLVKDVELEVCDPYQFLEVSCYTNKKIETSVALNFVVIIDIPYKEYRRDVKVRVTGKCGDHTFTQTQSMLHAKTASFSVLVKNPKLWWPQGYGEPNVYDLTYELLVDDEVKATGSMNIGIRFAKLIRTESLLDENSCFKFNINGVDVFARGSNWVPMDPYHSRDKARYAKALELFTECNCNMIRVWGGGVYEDEEFYDYCDRHGIMVWQDFMMACRTVDMSEKTMKNIEAEATWAIKKLRNHPSIVLWAGDNENDETLAGRGRNTDMNKITRKLLPDILFLHDNGRDYLASSPYIPAKYVHERKSGEKDIFVERHLWGARVYYKDKYYAQSNSHFVSEQGYLGCPSVETVKKMIDDEYLWPIFNEQWSLHDSDQNGGMWRLQVMYDEARQMFGFEPKNLEEFSLASQISQAEADKFFVENKRMKKKSGASGILFWNMLDGWPQATEAVVDYFYDKKLAFHYLKRSMVPVALMIEEQESWHYHLVVSNDTLKDVKGKYKVYNIDTNEVIVEDDFNIAANSADTLSGFWSLYSTQAFYVIEWEIDGKKYYNHYLAGMIPFNFDKYKEWLEKYNKIIGE